MYKEIVYPTGGFEVVNIYNPERRWAVLGCSMKREVTLKTVITDILAHMLVGDMLGGLLTLVKPNREALHTVAFTRCRDMMMICDSTKNSCTMGNTVKDFDDLNVRLLVDEIVILFKPNEGAENEIFHEALRWDIQVTEANTEKNIAANERWRKSASKFRVH